MRKREPSSLNGQQTEVRPDSSVEERTELVARIARIRTSFGSEPEFASYPTSQRFTIGPSLFGLGTTMIGGEPVLPLDSEISPPGITAPIGRHTQELFRDWTRDPEDSNSDKGTTEHSQHLPQASYRRVEEPVEVLHHTPGVPAREDYTTNAFTTIALKIERMKLSDCDDDSLQHKPSSARAELNREQYFLRRGINPDSQRDKVEIESRRVLHC